MNLIEQSYRSACARWSACDSRSRRSLASALRSFRIRYAYNSGRIENESITYHDTRSVFEDGRAVGYTGEVRTLFEIQNLSDCHELMLDGIAQNRPLDVEFVLEAHATLTKGTYDRDRWEKGERPGTFKQGDYVVGVHDCGALARDAPAAVERLVGELAQVTPTNALISAAYFHLMFEAIHPFADGNGRCGRALMNYLLVLNDHPPVIIFNEDKFAYYGALDVWDLEGDLQPMVDLLKAETVKTWDLNAR